MENKPFEGIDGDLGTEYVPYSTDVEILDEDSSSQEMDDEDESEETPNLPSVLTDDVHMSSEDEEFITDSLKESVERTDDALDTLSQEATLGAPSRIYEVMAQLTDAKTKALKELRAHKLSKKQMEMDNRKLDIAEKRITKEALGSIGSDANTISLKPRDFADMVENLKSQMKVEMTGDSVEAEVVDDDVEEKTESKT